MSDGKHTRGPTGTWPCHAVREVLASLHSDPDTARLGLSPASQEPRP